MVFFSYVPKYGELDYLYEKYIKFDTGKNFNFFFDVKNGIYNKDDNITDANKLEHAIEFISGVVNVIQYIKNRLSSFFDITNRLKFYFFCETGKSSYHKGIDMMYKTNRDINDYLARSDSDELFSQTTFFSINILKDIINMIPNAYFFLGEFREFDYIPYVVFKKCFKENDIGIVMSSDKDMYQLNSYAPGQFEQLEKLTCPSAWHPGRLFINADNYVDRIVAKDKIDVVGDIRDFMTNHFSLLRAIVGDGGDGISGINGIGYKTFLKIYEKFNLKDVILPRSEYNAKLKMLDFFRFDFIRENIIFDLEKVQLMTKEMKSSKTLSNLFIPDNIKRICQNLCLMDYDIMYGRRKDHEVIDPILENESKFKTSDEIQQFINTTGLWNEHSYYKITIEL